MKKVITCTNVGKSREYMYCLFKASMVMAYRNGLQSTESL